MQAGQAASAGRLKQLSTMRLTREELLMKLGAARDQSRTAWHLVTIDNRRSVR
jgi:hypothetical protein